MRVYRHSGNVQQQISANAFFGKAKTQSSHESHACSANRTSIAWEIKPIESNQPERIRPVDFNQPKP